MLCTGSPPFRTKERFSPVGFAKRFVSGLERPCAAEHSVPAETPTTRGGPHSGLVAHKRRPSGFGVSGLHMYSLGMETWREIERLCERGVRFSITIGANGYVVKVGNYARQATPSAETSSLDEAVLWLRGQVARGIVD